MAEREEWDVHHEVVGQAPFLTARRQDEEEGQPVRPMIANSIELNTDKANRATGSFGVFEAPKVGALNEEADENGLVWWKPREGADRQEEEEPVEKNPFRRWAAVEQEEEREGLSQDGIRPDPQSEVGVKVEESRKPKGNTKVHTPTREEVEEHEKHHCPFRAWCRHCVKGRGTNSQHRKKK